MSRSPNHTNIFGILTIPRAPQNLTRCRHCLQRKIIQFSRHRAHSPILKSRDFLPFPVNVDHGFHVLGHALGTTCTGRRQLDGLTRGSQSATQGKARRSSGEFAPRACQSKLSRFSRKIHPFRSGSRPVSVLAGLRTREIAPIGLGPHEILGGHNRTCTSRRCHLGPRSCAINRT